MKYIQEIAGKSGIYIIENEIDERIYVGSAVSFRHRCAVHKRFITQGKHGNPKLTNFANKYGIDKLIFRPILACKKNELLAKEQEYLDTLQPFDERGFNILRIAGAPTGYKHTEEAKKKMKGRPGNKWNEEQRKAMAERKKGIPRSEEVRRKVREGKKSVTKPLIIFDKNGFVERMESSYDASVKYGSTKNAIKHCLANKSKSSKGYVFIYEENVSKIGNIEDYVKERLNNNQLRKVLVTDNRDGSKTEYRSISEFSKVCKAPLSTICCSIKRETLVYGTYKVVYI
jgi:group I intron endonuclease